MYKIHLLPATFGDSILVEYGTRKQPFYILIDGGPYHNFEKLWEAIQNVAPQIKEVELLVVTHIDIDHIDGALKLLNQTNLPFNIKEVWFNGRAQLEEAAGLPDDTLGALQGEFISKLIKEKGYAHNTSFNGKSICVLDYNNLPTIRLEGGMEIVLLSPGVKSLIDLIPVWDKEIGDRNIDEEWEEETRYDDILGDRIENLQEMEFTEDKGKPNCSSIAFIGIYKDKSCLFAADSPSHVLLVAIDALLNKTGEEKLKIDGWKLAHHGSKKSSQDSIMKKIDCKQILVSSDGKRYEHPDETVIAKLLKHNGPDLSLYFNYKTKFNDMWDNEGLKKKYEYETFYPAIDDKPGITLEL